MITICAWCKRRRLPDGSWAQDWHFGDYELGEATHGMCEDCAKCAELELAAARSKREGVSRWKKKDVFS